MKTIKHLEVPGQYDHLCILSKRQKQINEKILAQVKATEKAKLDSGLYEYVETENRSMTLKRKTIE